MSTKVAALTAACLAFVASCTYREFETFQTRIELSCYPPDVGKIFITHCAQAGCHNARSKGAAGGLDLSTWTALFEGSSGGSAVIPFRTDHSFLLNFINDGHDPDITPQPPLMPYNLEPLSAQDYQTIKSWIADGAPDCNGGRFCDNPDRDKFYVTNQTCDLLYVFDAEKKVVMRAIDVGGDPNFSENPHTLRFSPDGLYYYICFAANGQYFEKYRASDDSLIARLDLVKAGGWNTFCISPDGSKAFVVDYDNEVVAGVDCASMTLLPGLNPVNPWQGMPSFGKPHGSRISPDGKFLYVTMQKGNGLAKMDAHWMPFNTYPIIQFPVPGLAGPHEIEFSPDGSLYFVTCQDSNDVYIFDAANDAYLKSIGTADEPVEMEVITSRPLLFVTCMEGNAVSIINYEDTTLVKTITVGEQPHGISADEKRGIVYVANRNVNPSGPAPHHLSDCGNGRNGYLVAIDINTLELVPGFKFELSVDPYALRVRK